jgi:hypothetical protein
MKAVNIYDNQGNRICKIEELLNWKNVLLSFTPISREWKDHLVVERWAWETAQQVAYWEAGGNKATMEEGKLLYDYGALCQACLKYSILPEVKRRNREVIGYSCITGDCLMRGVRIPKILVEKVAEKPLGKNYVYSYSLEDILIGNDFILLQSKILKENPLTYEFIVRRKDNSTLSPEMCNEVKDTIVNYLRNNLRQYKGLTYKLVTTDLANAPDIFTILVAVIITHIEDGFILPKIFGLRREHS